MFVKRIIYILVLLLADLLFVPPLQAQIITTIAGDGVQGSSDNAPATIARLNKPSALSLDRAGNIYVADEGNNNIRKISIKGYISTFIGNPDTGPVSLHGIATDRSDNIYI